VVSELTSSLAKVDSWKTPADRILAAASSADTLFDANACMSTRALLREWEYTAIHVVRDPRDIVVSAYFSHRHSHPIHRESWAAQRRKLASASTEEGLLATIDFLGFVFEPLAEWEFAPYLQEWKFEELTADPSHWVGQLCHRFGWPKDRLAEVLERHSFRKLSEGREPGEERPDHHYRKGMAGDWKNYFTPQVSHAFTRRYGHLLEKWGYA
jgi:hypothetical protein